MATKKSKLTLREAILSKEGNKKFPVIQMVRDDPDAAAVISKLTKSVRHPATYGTAGERTYNNPNVGEFKTIAQRTANNISDNLTAMQMLPDLELASQILVSIVLSPKDMLTVETYFTAGDEIVSTELKTQLLNKIDQYFTDKYDLTTFLQKALKDILFISGSHPMIVLPENSVDHAINSDASISMESMSDVFHSDGTLKPLGLLGSNDIQNTNESAIKFSMESFDRSLMGVRTYNPDLTIKLDNKTYTSNIKVIDNFNALKMPSLQKKAIQIKHDRLINKKSPINFEYLNGKDRLNITDRTLSDILFKSKSNIYQMMEVLKTDADLDRMMIGEPLILHLPSESVIPVFIPGSPDKQIGFFVLLDINGNPLDLSSETDNYSQLANLMGSGQSTFAGAMMNKAKQMFNGFDCNNDEHLNYISNIYGDMVEKDLLNRLKNGRYPSGVSIARKEEIYRIMLARSLANKNTQLLWVPDTMITYFAFKYNAFGIGKSLLDDLKIVNSLRILTTMANVMAMMKNSIARTGVRIKFDPEDPNPQKTLEMVVHEILRSRQQMIPWGTINPSDIADWAVKAGLEFVYEGHPGMPDVGIDFEDKASSVAEPNTDLIEELRKQTAMGLGISPDLIDASIQPEFATSVVRNNIMMSKNALQIQNQFLPLVTDHVNKIISATPGLLNDLLNILYDEFEDINLTPLLKNKVLGNEELKATVCKRVLKDFIDTLKINLPKPDGVALDNQFEALETVERIIEKAVEAYVNSDIFGSEIAGEMGNSVENIKSIIKSYFMRKYMADNGIFPDMNEILDTFDKEGFENELYSSQVNINRSIIKNFGKFLIDLRYAKEKGDKLLEILGAEGDGGSGDSYFGSSDGSDESIEDDGGDFDMDDDFDMGDDTVDVDESDENIDTTEENE